MSEMSKQESVYSVYLAVYYLVIHAAWMSFEQLLVAWELISVCG